MLQNLEFYNNPDGSVSVKPLDEPMYVYDEGCRKLTDEMLAIIRDLFPDAFTRLSELYSKSERNPDYYNFRIVHRFIRCNLGEYDSLRYDVNKIGELNMEEVRCPLRGECANEGVICKPRLHTTLTSRETEIAKMLGEGLTKQEIATELYISVYTVNRHVANIKAKTGLVCTSQIITRFKPQYD